MNQSRNFTDKKREKKGIFIRKERNILYLCNPKNVELIRGERKGIKKFFELLR
jgi:hypothetical protein